MSEEGEILGVPFKLERRSLQDQVMALQGQVAMLGERLKAVEASEAGKGAVGRLTDLNIRVSELESLHRQGEGRGVWAESIEFGIAGLEERFLEGGTVATLQAAVMELQSHVEALENFARHRPAGAAYLSSRPETSPAGPVVGWTTELPTKPGFYWWRSNEEWVAEPCRVAYKFVGGDLEVMFLGIQGHADLALSETSEWYGPIEPPE